MLTSTSLRERPAPASSCVELAEPLGNIVRVAPEPVPALPDVGDAPERGVALAAEVDRRMRLLHGLRVLAARRQVVELAVELGDRIGPQSASSPRGTHGSDRRAARTARRPRRTPPRASRRRRRSRSVRPESQSTAATSFAVYTGLRCGTRQMPVPSRIVDRVRGEEGERRERLEDPVLATGRDLAVGGVRVLRLVLVEQDDVLGDPDRVEPALLGRREARVAMYSGVAHGLASGANSPTFMRSPPDAART